MITIGSDAYNGGAAALTSPKLIDVGGGAAPELEVAPTPDEFSQRLEHTVFVGKADRDRVKQMCKPPAQTPAAKSGRANYLFLRTQTRSFGLQTALEDARGW
jgi:hypothetical protein